MFKQQSLIIAGKFDEIALKHKIISRKNSVCNKIFWHKQLKVRMNLLILAIFVAVAAETRYSPEQEEIVFFDHIVSTVVLFASQEK